MEHLVQFTVSIEDEAIQNKLNKKAYDDIIIRLTEDAKKNLPKKQVVKWNEEPGIDWKYIAYDIIESFVKDNKEEVIELAAKKLCESTKRSKKYQEKLKEITDEA